MNKIIRMLKIIAAAPFALAMRAVEDIDMEELTRAVDRRVARAEAAVLRDYFAQHGIEGEQAEQVEESYRERRRQTQPDAGELDRLRQRAETAEKAALQARTSGEALAHMARMGVPQGCEQDILLLVSAQLEKSDRQDGDAVGAAVESVLARLPGLAGQSASAGSRGSFPRQDDGAAVWQAQLDRARASGDNAAAVGIITLAAQKGVALR